MKIFSLQSKTGLVVWSLVLGVLVGVFVNNFFVSQPSFCNVPNQAFAPELQELSTCDSQFRLHGWPVKYPQINKAYDISSNDVQDVYIQLYNYAFWVVVVLIILSLIRYFKKKNTNPSVSS